MGWRTDWLYLLVFREVESTWERAQRDACSSPRLFALAPEAVVVQECAAMNFEAAYPQPPVSRQWRYAGTGFEEEPPGKLPEPTRTRDDDGFYRTGLVRFHITSDRKQVGFIVILGPLYGRGCVLKVQGQGKRARLVRDSRFNSWIS
jgi:hypothetical protein